MASGSKKEESQADLEELKYHLLGALKGIQAEPPASKVVAKSAAEIKSELATEDREDRIHARLWRGRYAKWMLVGLALEAALAFVFAFALGFKWLQVDKEIATVFLLGVFAQSAGIVAIITRGLFGVEAKSSLRDRE